MTDRFIPLSILLYFFTDMIGLGAQIFILFFKMSLKSFHSDKIYPYILAHIFKSNI